MENQVRFDNVGYIPLAGWILRNCPDSLEFTKKNRKSEQRWHSELRVICSMNSQSLPCFFGINSLKNGKSG